MTITMPAKRKVKTAAPAPAPAPTKKKQRKTQEDSEEAFRNDDMDRSVLGGLAGGYRITGNDPSSDPTTTVFKVPFNDKYIICEHRSKDANENDENDDDNSTRSQPSLIFTHGAGGGIENPATASFADGFSEISPVVCFQGTMNLQSRVKTFHALIEHEKWGEALGGRSMGARAAVITANERAKKKKTTKKEEEEEGIVAVVKTLVLVSYPLVGAGKGDLRDAILRDLAADVDVLFVVGSQDSMCDLAKLREVRNKMDSKTWLLEVKGADHSMSLKDKKGVEAIRRKTGAVAAEWLKNRDGNKRYSFVTWDGEASEVTGGDWLNDGNQIETSKTTKSKKGK